MTRDDILISNSMLLKRSLVEDPYVRVVTQALLTLTLSMKNSKRRGAVKVLFTFVLKHSKFNVPIRFQTSYCDPHSPRARA